MNRHARLVALVVVVVLLGARAARAQPAPHAQAPATASSAPAPAAEPAPDEDDGDPLPPEEPAVPRTLAPRVAALRRVATRATTCYEIHQAREEHSPDPRCGGWYAQLAGGGAAAAHAIAGVLRARTGAESRYIDRHDGSVSATATRLVRLLGATGAPVAAPYLLLIAEEATHDDALGDLVRRAAVDALDALTWQDLTPWPPWTARTDEYGDAVADLAPELAAWHRWYARHAAEAPRAWRAAGLARARENLQSDDAVARFAAIRRLADRPGDRGAVRAALATLLARADLPDVAHAYVARFARRRGLVPRATR